MGIVVVQGRRKEERQWRRGKRGGGQEGWTRGKGKSKEAEENCGRSRRRRRRGRKKRRKRRREGGKVEGREKAGEARLQQQQQVGVVGMVTVPNYKGNITHRRESITFYTELRDSPSG